jgi:energy-coupling factor transport system ATP-binding protein
MDKAGVRIAVQNLSFAYGLGANYGGANYGGTDSRENPSGARQVLSGVSFVVRDGEFVSILGPNGSGKSTLLSCINGLCTPPSGTVTVYDRDGNAYDPVDDDQLDTIRRITGTVLQNPENQIVAPVVEEDCAFGPENLHLPPDVVAERVSSALRQTGIEELRDRTTQFLSGGEKQRLAIAGALAMGSDILLLDECTAMIDPAGRDRFYALIDELVQNGRTVIQITHSAEDAARSSRCIVLDKGVITYDGPYRPVAETTAPPKPKPTSEGRPCAWRPCVSFDHVSHVYSAETAQKRSALADISLHIGENERVAIVGATGSGKSTVLKHINALLLPSIGKVTVFGQDTLDRKTSLMSLRRRAALALQSPENALFETHIADDIAYGARNIGLKGRALVQRVRETMEAVGLPFAEFADRETSTLSGGEARLAALAGIFVLDSDIVLLDEPTAGLDTEHSARIIALLDDLKKRGKTIIASTHAPEFAAYFDRIVTMTDGRCAEKTATDKPAAETPAPTAQSEAAPVTTLTIAPITATPTKRRRKTGLEFFRNTPFGVLSGADSPLRQLSAGIKLLAAVLSIIAAAMIPVTAFPLVLFAACLIAGRVWGNIRPDRLLRSILPMLPVLTIFIALRLIFSWPGDTSRILLKIGIVTVTIQEIRETVLTLIRLFTMLTVITLYASTTSLRETLAAVKKLLTVRHRGSPNTLARDTVLVLSIALRFVPLITAEAEHIVASQISRCAKTSGLAKLAALKAMIVPLFLRSLERSQTLAKAMLLRLYR